MSSFNQTPNSLFLHLAKCSHFLDLIVKKKKISKEIDKKTLISFFVETCSILEEVFFFFFIFSVFLISFFVCQKVLKAAFFSFIYPSKQHSNVAYPKPLATPQKIYKINIYINICFFHLFPKFPGFRGLKVRTRGPHSIFSMGEHKYVLPYSHGRLIYF